ncbi:hypothetical protein, partial [Pseudomonas koreensis]|uniref:hypothetical protein n=1 Tax=Pseudomonas koreensis TaxID=198620 RepID=UPI001E436177
MADTQHRGGSRAGKWKRAIIVRHPLLFNVKLSLIDVRGLLFSVGAAAGCDLLIFVFKKKMKK